MAAAPTEPTAGVQAAPLVLCRVCDRPVRTGRARADRLGEGCRRKLQARWRRRFQQLALLPVAAATGRTDPAREQHRHALFELGQITAALVERTEQLEQAVNDATTVPPDPKAPHKYRPGDKATDWRGGDVTPCLWCNRLRQNSIHRRPRQPRTAKANPRQVLVDEAARDRDRAVLGERDDD